MPAPGFLMRDTGSEGDGRTFNCIHRDWEGLHVRWPGIGGQELQGFVVWGGVGRGGAVGGGGRAGVRLEGSGGLAHSTARPAAGCSVGRPSLAQSRRLRSVLAPPQSRTGAHGGAGGGGDGGG